ncbi:hypothetical protein [Streptomyces sp. CB01881]|uniref:hypothetical protein n=1 Tax=Streptomyces sp. CB01881 TaxID=2078691 RepID=UPI000CDC1999|nr:hypothetical protein [Streptomyces sp. CB01881]AUY50202.1 hypothetical protein C2142_16125 [Streptomyces sp. CB01881]TYC73595.1 hypothetical protein EH183_16105 [Streptomyces sp. CB01881]
MKDHHLVSRHTDETTNADDLSDAFSDGLAEGISDGLAVAHGEPLTVLVTVLVTDVVTFAERVLVHRWAPVARGGRSRHG